MRWVVALMALAPLMAGCASVTRGWNEQVAFSSLPPGAIVQLSTGLACTAPCVLQMSRKDDFFATFSLPGYITESVEIRGEVAGMGVAGFAGNAILGGVVGAGIDIASGAALDHCPNPVAVIMRRIGSTQPPDIIGNRCQWQMNRDSGPPAAAERTQAY